LQYYQWGYGIGTRSGIAQVSPYAGSALDAYTAYEFNCVYESWIGFPDGCILVDNVARDRGAKMEPVAGIVSKAVGLGYILNVYYPLWFTAPDPELYYEVGSSGNRAGLISFFGEERGSFVNAPGH